MIRMLISIPESHTHSARELRNIILSDWPVYTIEEYNAAQGIHATRADHRCSDCDPIISREIAESNGLE